MCAKLSQQSRHNDAVVLALQSGRRQKTALTRLHYFPTYGQFYGYCQPKGDAVNKYKESEATVEFLMKQPMSPEAYTGLNPCAKKTTEKVGQDKPSFDITGRYYSREHPLSTFVINQAGIHFECIASTVLHRDSKRSGDHRPFSEIHGDLKNDGKFLWFNRTLPSNYGTIKESGGHLVDPVSRNLEKEESEIKLYPIEKRPTWMGSSHEIMVSNWDLDLIERYELAPLTPGQMHLIRSIFKKDDLDKLFTRYFNLNQKRAFHELYWRIKETNKKEHSDYAPEKKLDRFNDVDLPLVKFYAKQLLTLQKWTSNRNVTRSHIDWIQIMMDNTIPSKGSVDDVFSKYLGLRVSPKDRRGEHVYEFTIILSGISLLFGGFVGTVRVKKTSGTPWKKDKEFEITLYGANVTITLPDVKLGEKFVGIARSYIEWTENDIPGTVRMMRASASIGLEIASAQAGFMHVLGTGVFPPLDVFFVDANVGMPNLQKIAEEYFEGKLTPILKTETVGGGKQAAVLARKQLLGCWLI